MNIIYARISTAAQNESRQIKSGDKSFIDKCSGAIKFMDRPSARKLIEFLKLNPNAVTNIMSVCRIGRSTLDILKTVEYFKANNYKLRIENLGMDSSSPFFDLMISLLATLADHEKNIIKERCRTGIEVAKSKGIYTGRKLGTKDDRVKILNKHRDIVLCLNQKMKITDISNVTNKTRATIYKVKKIL